MNEDNDLQELLEGPVGEMAREFFAAREYAMATAQYPRKEFVPKGRSKVPFVLDDNETWLAVIFPDGEVKPLPFGYELDDDDIAVDDDTVLMSTMSLMHRAVRYVPVRKGFQPPDDEAFEMDRLLEQALEEETDDSAFEFDGLEFQMGMFLGAESGEPFTGVATLHWENGTLKKEAHFSEGALNGKMTWWYESGQKELEDDYLNSQRHGKHRAWHENGELWAEGSSVNGDRQGTWRWWHDNGGLAEESEYTDGLAHGKHEKWHANGTRALLTTFKEGEEHGIHKEWYESGQLEAIVPMVDGEVHGTLKYWDEDGEQEGDVEFVEGEPVTNAGEEATGEDVEELKERIMELVESEEAKAAVEGLIFTVEEAADGDLDQVAEALREAIDDLDQKLETSHSDIDAKVPLIEATLEGDIKEIRRLLKEGAEADIGPPGFVYAIVADQPKAFEVYVKYGIDVAKEFNWDNGDDSVLPDVNAFILAAATGNTWAVTRLLELGADPNLETSSGQTPLRMAILNGQDEVVDLLFDQIGDVSTSSAGRVLVAAAKAENAELVKRCLEAGIPANSTDGSGWTALKCAVNDFDNETAELLLQHGADCDIADEEGWTPLLNAIENRDLDLVNLLLSNGADPNSAPGVEDDEGQQGFSALMRAALYGESEILESLLAAGADPMQTDSDGFSAIHYAALHRHPSCAAVLLAHGADVNAVGNNKTPVGSFLFGLADAMANDSEVDEEAAIELLQLLIKNGANWLDAVHEVFVESEAGQLTALEIALAAIKKLKLKKLSKALSRISEDVWMTDSDPWRTAIRAGDKDAICSLLSKHLPIKGDRTLYKALITALSILVVYEKKYRLFRKEVSGFSERFSSAEAYKAAVSDISRLLIESGARVRIRSVTDKKILEALSADENTAALAHAAIDDPVEWAHKRARDAWKHMKEKHDVYSRRDFHPTAIEALENLLSVVETTDAGALDTEEVDMFSAILAGIYTDDWDVDNAYRHVAVLKSHDYCPDLSGPGLPEFDHFQFVESLSTLTKRLSAAGRDKEAGETLDYLKDIYRRAELEYKPYIDEPASILAGKKKLRIGLYHPRQAENALFLDLIDEKKYGQLLQKFERQEKAKSQK